MLVALFFYGYAAGVFSSRKLAQATHDAIAFRDICANIHPDPCDYPYLREPRRPCAWTQRAQAVEMPPHRHRWGKCR
jgi:hypothetical protein